MLEALTAWLERVHAAPHLGWFLYGAWLGYLVVLAGWIVLQKREPVATLSWLLALAALPYLGFVIYYFLGPQRIRRKRLRRTRSRASLRAALPAVASANDSVELARLAGAATDYGPSSCTDTRLLVDGAATFEALLAAIAQATHHVHLEYYIVEPDRSGARLREALSERARAGVRVRLLLDAIGSARCGRRFLAPLRAAGAEVAWFHPTRLRRFWRRPWLNLRTHRKIVVIDGRIGFTGGINISDTQDERLRTDAYRDLHLRLEGQIVRWLQLTFVEDWHYATGVALRDDRLWPGLVRGGVPAQAIPSGPDSSWEAIHRLHVEALHNARERAWLVTPYFVPGEAARMALTSAALRGADVRLLVPRWSDSRLVTLAARSYFDELLAAGVRIFEYLPRMLHSKALLVDEDTVILGSANFDHRSFRLNFELSLLLQDPGLARRLTEVIEADLARSREVRTPAGRRPLGPRLAEAVARLLSPLL